MAKLFLFSTFLLSFLVASFVAPCSIPSSISINVPKTVPAGEPIAKVEAVGCDASTLLLSLDEADFSLLSDGTIVAVRPVSVGTGRTFSVRARDRNGPQSEMEVHLISESEPETNQIEQAILKRTKRRWSPPPFNILENYKGNFPMHVDYIVSDSSKDYNVYYTLSGPGVDQYPQGIFEINPETGGLSVLASVDREQFPSFTLIVDAIDKVTNQRRDEPLDIVVKVDDVNDNAPEFSGQLEFTVFEHSAPGTVVGQVTATDRDDPNTDHVRIKFTLLNDLEYFAIHPETGVITTISNTLDREKKEKHLVTVVIKDLKGDPGGLSNTGTTTITLGDINDNPPTFTETSYKVTVPENEVEKLILRIPVEDKDLINTPNWISKFVITKGNENGNFRMDVDPKTNEGLLYVTKPLDYEKSNTVKLEISARNQAELSGTTAQWLSIPVDVTVKDVDEGPEFSAPTITFNVKENLPNGTLIGTYKAIDPETKKSDGITYYKSSDPGHWVSVDRNTGELRVSNTIDLESPLVKNKMYNISMKAVDASSKTGTGTVILVIEDVNDNEPTIPAESLLCDSKTEEPKSLIVTAEDRDPYPHSAPFSFELPAEYDEKWTLKSYNETSCLLKPKWKLPTGFHKVSVIIKDLQGIGKKQTTTVHICQCENGACIAPQSSVALGPLGILTMLLPAALLLLLLLALAFFCSTQREKMKIEGDVGYSSGILLQSNTEAPGDEVEFFGAKPGVEQSVHGSIKGSIFDGKHIGNHSSSTIGGYSIHGGGLKQMSAHNFSSLPHYSQHVGSQLIGNQLVESQLIGNQLVGNQLVESQLIGSGMGYKTMNTNRDWQTHSSYLNQKLDAMTEQENGLYTDGTIQYRFEGNGSATGSMECCNNIGHSNNLDFLNTLGPKFRPLAETCSKR